MINILDRNKTMWIISILAAFTLWIYVTSDQNPKMFDTLNRIPVKLVNTESLEEKGLVISDSQEYFIDIRIYGRKTQLYNIKKSAISVEADVSQLDSKGTHFVPVTILGLPDDVEISSKNPEAIQITIDQIISQEREIRVDIKGSPAEGMASLAYIVNPSKATLEGPEEVLNSIRNVVASIDITNATQEVNGKLPLKAIDSDGNEVGDIKITPEYVDVTIPVRPTKEVPIIPQTTGDVADEHILIGVDVTPVKIIIGAESNQLSNISQIFTEKISIANQSKSFEKKVKLLLPEGIEVIGDEPAVIVKITIQPFVEKTFEVSKINVINLREDLVIQEDLLDVPVQITVKGPTGKVNSINEEDILLSIDAKDLQEGQHEVPIRVEVPEGVTVEKMEPDTLKVHIQGKVE